MTWPISWGEINDHLKNHPSGVASWNDLEDKPFSEETKNVETILVDQKAFRMGDQNTFTETEVDKYNTYQVLFSSDRNIYSGKRYKIIIDGITYTGTAGDDTYFDDDGYLISSAISVQLTDENGNDCGVFVDICHDTHEFYYIYKNSNLELGHIGVFSIIELGEVTTIKTLDPEFLPKAEAVADVTAAPTAEEFNALLISLRNAGYLAT